MNGRLNFGMDFGSLGCRLAYVGPGGEAVALSPPRRWDGARHWLRCAPQHNSRVGAEFHTLKDLLDGEWDGGASAAAIERFFCDVLATCEEQTSRPADQLAIAVPAIYSASRRTVLREAAIAAGFRDVHLVNDAMAAAVAHTSGGTESRTILVYSLGYGGYEVSAVRVAKGRYRTMAYLGDASTGGAVFDRILLAGIRQALQERHCWPGDGAFDQDAWLELREAAQRLKENLSTEDAVSLDVSDTSGRGGVFRLSFYRAEFERAIEPLVAASLDSARTLLEESNLTLSDLDEVLFVGGGSRIALAERLARARFGRPPVTGAENILALGAAHYATQHLERPAADTGPQVLPEASIVKSRFSLNAVLPGPEQRPAGRLLQLGLPALESFPVREALVRARVHWSELLRETRSVISEGSHREAMAFFGQIREELKELLDCPLDSPAAEPLVSESPRIKSEAERALRRAEDHLQAGRYFQAVGYAHRSFAVDPESSLVLQRVIDIHCRAGLAANRPDQYAESVGWLLCALSHDRTSREVHEAIAQRHFMHAGQAQEIGDREGALRALEECLCFNPDHAGGGSLQRQLLEPATPQPSVSGPDSNAGESRPA